MATEAMAILADAPPRVEVTALPAESYEVNFTTPDDIVSINLGLVEGIHAFDSDKVQHSTTMPNMMRLHPAGSTTFCRGDRVDNELFMFAIDPSIREELVEESRIGSFRQIERVYENLSSPSVLLLAQTARRFVLAGEPGGRLAKESLGILALTEALMAISNELASRAQPRVLDKKRLNTVIAAIDDRLSENVGLAELAATVGLTPYYFARAFRSATGLSPHQYVLERRVVRARAMLDENRDSLADIAYAVGFSSQAHMTDVFKKRLGVTPGRYRLQRQT